MRVEAVRGQASHKHSNHKWQRAKALGADTKGFIGFGRKLSIARLLVLVASYDCLFNRVIHVTIQINDS